MDLQQIEKAPSDLDLAKENAALTAQLADARAAMEDYMRRAVCAEGACAGLQKELQQTRAALGSQVHTLGGSVSASRKFDVQQRIGQMVVEAYQRPFSSGIRLPVALWSLRTELRRKNREPEQ